MGKESGTLLSEGRASSASAERVVRALFEKMILLAVQKKAFSLTADMEEQEEKAWQGLCCCCMDMEGVNMLAAIA